MGNAKSINCKKACCCLTNIVPRLSRRENDQAIYKSIPSSNADSAPLKETQLTIMNGSDSEPSTALPSRSASLVKSQKNTQAEQLLKESLIDDEDQNEMQHLYSPSTPKKSEKDVQYISPPMSQEKNGRKSEDPENETAHETPKDKTFIYLNEWQESLASLCSEKIREITQIVQEPLDGYEQIYKDEKTSHQLQLYMKSYISAENFRVNIVRGEYISPCDPETYIRFMNNIKEQAKLDSNIEISVEEENFHENNFIFYIRYKKILFMSQRDFIYAKNFRCLDQEKNVWADCATSIPYEKYPTAENIVRGNVIKSGHLVEEFENKAEPGKKFSKVKLYSEIDLKLNVPPFMTKPATVNEMRKYVEKCSKRLEEIMREKTEASL